MRLASPGLRAHNPEVAGSAGRGAYGESRVQASSFNWLKIVTMSSGMDSGGMA